VRLRPIDHAPTAVRLDGAPLTARFDANDRAVIVELPPTLGDTFTLELDVDLALEARPRVAVPVEVTLPPGTPADAVIHVASSANGWTHQPLERVDATHARGTLEVERGAWFLYKYTRGSWDTVEKHADCSELADRYRYGAADDTQVDVVSRWRDDGC
jgi:alpha-glucosidase